MRDPASRHAPARPVGSEARRVGAIPGAAQRAHGLAVILVTTMMILTDLINNAATTAVMAPIALGAITQFGVNPDTLLMAVAIGASRAFLTPIGHQNNTLILGPGGFRFGDDCKLGVPLELLVITVALPMPLLLWPL